MPPRRPAPPLPAHPEAPSLRALLIAAREAAGLSQRALARQVSELRGGELEVWRRLISRYESPRGRGADGAPQEPTLETAAAVAEALGLELNVRLVPRRNPAGPP